MADIFGATPTFGGAFAMDEAILSFSGPTGDGGLGYLVQSLGAQYTRPVQRIFELGPTKTTYYVTGRSEGRMQISRLAAPAPVNAAFLKQFADPCKVKDNNFVVSATPGSRCDGNINGQAIVPSRYKFGYCLVDALQFQMAVQAIALTENLSMVFASMETAVS